MNAENFINLVKELTEQSISVLDKKRREYAEDHDVLENFKSAAGCQAVPPSQALIGMATKHFVSIAKMAKDPHLYGGPTWNEKLGDMRNYMFLLYAILVDEGVFSQEVAPPPMSPLNVKR